VKKGLAGGRASAPTDSKIEASFCCCISCAVGKNCCLCNLCTAFRDLHEKEGDLELMTDIVADIEADATTALRMCKDKEQRYLYVRFLINEGISHYSEAGRVLATYRIGNNANEKINVCRKRFAEAYEISTRTIDRIIVQVRDIFASLK
jgi:hypothetical protein